MDCFIDVSSADICTHISTMSVIDVIIEHLHRHHDVREDNKKKAMSKLSPEVL